MIERGCGDLPLRAPDLERLFEAAAWRDAAALSSVLGGGALAGHLQRPSCAAFSVLRPGACARRSLALAGRLLVAFDAVNAPGPKRWSLEGATQLTRRTLLPGPGQAEFTRSEGRLEVVSKRPGAEAFFLHVFSAGPLEVEELSSVDLAGARAGDWVVLFHTDVTSAWSPVYFDVSGGATLHYLLVGLAAGQWDLWRDGFLEQVQEPLLPGEGALYFEGPPGGYFLRRFS